MTGDELVHGWKEERMNGRMVPRRIMVFVFRLCLLGIILPSLWRENLTLRIFSIFFQLVMRWLGRWLQRWKDGTKTDNGICRNLVTLKMVTPKLLGTRLHRTQPFCGVQHFFWFIFWFFFWTFFLIFFLTFFLNFFFFFF